MTLILLSHFLLLVHQVPPHRWLLSNVNVANSRSDSFCSETNTKNKEKNEKPFMTKFLPLSNVSVFRNLTFFFLCFLAVFVLTSLNVPPGFYLVNIPFYVQRGCFETDYIIIISSSVLLSWTV